MLNQEKPQLDFGKYLKVILITHDQQASFALLVKTTPQQRARRAVLIRSLLRQVGMLALNIAPDNQPLVAQFGETLMQVHSMLAQAINRPEISSDMAIKGLATYISLLNQEFAEYMGFDLVNEDGERAYRKGRVENIDKVDSGKVMALQMLDNLLAEVVCCAEFDYQEMLEVWLEKPDILVNCAYIKDEAGNLEPYPKVGVLFDA